ncbi:mitochondrial inner membrane protein OXA1 [Capsicum annuum]|uniref:mitochondrial inner membrane protein OXA1 n=1 Tax=Capsicum annuum TaxID=4072 RepID=UPI001FB121D1|nr:mitochondrial inner membrane protein OXA1 [Capsicum annuum]XP_047270148.1 mitochondrial inner membrane protein OXA1 [Capsicum annuum]XP_047270153.1 mitochondrial inner membrane protein OXA1 [Capsicum annuum]XP_047270157.1 mitochondrial inner membrane protein OXA1 [Capsicum annuum]
MACRRSITTRAKLLYQQQRATPAFSYFHKDDDDRKNPEPSFENSRIPSFSQPRYMGSASGANSFIGSRSPYQDRRFCASGPFIPMSYGSFLIRNMSTDIGGGADKIDYMTDVAEVLADKAVEAVVSQAPAVNEVAIAAADCYLPVKALMYLMDYVHIFTGFEWWGSIVATSIMIRLFTLPFMINQLKATSKLTLLRPKLEEIKDEMQNKGMAPAAVADGQKRMQELMREYGVTPFTPLKGLLIQGPIFVSFFMAIRSMVDNVPSLKTGGAFWFTDLTTPDAMYIFPILTALTFWITVELNAQEGLEGNPAAKTIKNVSRGFAALTVPLTATFPKAIFCYWITSNLFSLSYGLVIKSPAVKKALGVPIIPVSPPTEQKPALPFFETLKKYAAAQQHIAAQQHAAKQNAEASQQPAVSSPPVEESRSTSRRIPASSVLSQRIRSLEKEVKGRKKNKKR